MRDYYLVGWRIKKLARTWTEQELYCSEPCWGSGDTILEFTDGSMEKYYDCLELTPGAIKRRLAYLWFKRKLKLPDKWNGEIDFL